MRYARGIGLPLIASIAVTRGLLGFGIGLLLAGKLKRDQRLQVGRALVAVGAITTIPLIATIRRSRRELPESRLRAGAL